MWAINFYKSFFRTVLSYMNNQLSKSRSVHTSVQSMSECRSFQTKRVQGECCSKKLVSASKKRALHALFFGHSVRLLMHYFAAFRTSKLTIMPTIISNLSKISSFEQIARLLVSLLNVSAISCHQNSIKADLIEQWFKRTSFSLTKEMPK